MRVPSGIVGYDDEPGFAQPVLVQGAGPGPRVILAKLDRVVPCSRNPSDGARWRDIATEVLAENYGLTRVQAELLHALALGPQGF